LVFGGEFSPDRTRLSPTLIEGPGVSELEACREESFGPMATLQTFTSDDEAVQLSNSSRYGLLGSILSRNAVRARRLAARLEVGTVLLNEVVYGPGIGQAPWGGIKDSGMGRSHGEQGLLEAVHARHIHEPRFWVSRLAAFKSPWWFPYSPLQKAVFESLTELYRRSPWRRLKALPRLVYRSAKLLLEEPRI
jgi:delta 1-pyrroline-5-carboxylate dehydrogenase